MRFSILFFLLNCGLSYGLNWTQGAYPDTSWETGYAELGFGDGEEITMLFEGNTTYYFRRDFLVSRLENYASLELYMKYDDGFVAYINGVEVARANMPEGMPDYYTYASSEHEGSDFELFYLDLQTLIDTFSYTDSYEMSIAVEVHSCGPSDEDLSFDLKLEASGTPLVSESSLWRYYQDRYPDVIPTDPVTMILKPLPNIPVIQKRGEDFIIECDAPFATDNWEATLRTEWFEIPLVVISHQYNQWEYKWVLDVNIPNGTPFELYDLILRAGDICDTSRNSVKVIDQFRDSFYFVHITDPHIPEHYSGFNTVPYLEKALREINIINPEFILLTGDLVNRPYQDQCEIAQHTLFRSEAPVFLTVGNHDVGDMRWFFWKYFGWDRLYSGHEDNEGIHTQNYSFDYGRCHFSGVECYQNYSGFDWQTYGWCSLIGEQVDWLQGDLNSTVGPFKCIFYHYDFTWGQILNIASDCAVDLLLWGHLHSNSVLNYGSLLSVLTGETYGSNGVFRLIRIDSTGVSDWPLLGHQRRDITLFFDCQNDGTQSEITATIINEYYETFENGLIRFFIPLYSGGYRVTGGEVIQTVETPQFSIYYVRVNIPRGVTLVSISPREGIEESLYQKPISIYPNPSRGVLNIRSKEAFIAGIRVYDLSGMFVEDIEVKKEKGRMTLDLVDLPKGIYFVSLESDQGNLTKRVILID